MLHRCACRRAVSPLPHVWSLTPNSLYLRHQQPALLYLSPACLLASMGVGVVTGEFMRLVKFAKEEEKDEGKGKEEKLGDGDGSGSDKDTSGAEASNDNDDDDDGGLRQRRAVTAASS